MLPVPPRKALGLALAASAAALWPGLAEARRKPPTPAKAKVAKSERKDGPVGQRGPHVTYVTSGGFYVGVGAEDGLKVGATLTFQRRGQTFATCTVESVAQHYARCPAQAGIKPGDAFVAGALTKPVPPEVKPLPPLISRAEAARERAALGLTRFSLVEFSGKQSTLDRLSSQHYRAEIDLAESLYSASTSADSTFAIQTVNAAIRDAEIAGGFHATIDLTVLSYLQRPVMYRYPDPSATQVFVRQLELSYRSPTNPLTFAVGRILPTQAPSVGVLDGVQVGVRNSAHTLEGGVLGGVTPDDVTTAPSFDRPILGAYFGSTQTSHGSESWLQVNAVVTARELPGLGWHSALDASAMWSVGRWLDVAGEVRAGVGVAQASTPIELATFDLNLRPVEQAQIWASVRYLDDPLNQYLQPGSISFINAGLFANGAASYDFGALSVLVTGNFSQDQVTNLSRFLVGPEVTLPKLLGSLGGLGLGYEEDFGWMAGRDAYVQLSLFPASVFQLNLRGAYFSSVLANLVTGGPTESGLAGTLEARLRIARWLSAQASVMSQVELTNAQSLGVGVNGTVSLTARF